jgi:hypothetical protein
MILEIIRQRLALLQPLAQFGMRESRATIMVPVSDSRVLVGYFEASPEFPSSAG